MAEGGYALIYRRVLDDPDFANASEALAFVYLILKAAWRDCSVRYKGQRVDLKRGQLAISVRDLGRDLDWSKSRCLRFLKHLTERDKIGTDAGTGVNVVTIRKYDEYQLDPDKRGTPSEPDTGQQRDSGGTQNNKGNTLNEGKEEKLTPSGDGHPYVFEGRVVRLTEMDFRRWEKNFPNLDLRAVLQSRDDWLATEADEKTRAKWFMATSNYLAALQQKAVVTERQTSGGFQI